MEELAAVDKGQHNVELLGGLEGELHGNNERVVDLSQYRTFGKSMSNFGARDDVGFSNRLEGVDSASVALPERDKG